LVGHAPEARRATTSSADNSGAQQATDKHSLYFPFDSAQIDDHDKPTLETVVRELKAKGGWVRIEGNCDERGTTEYNLVLGDRRARAAADYVERMGLAPIKVNYVSYGSERPKDPRHNDSAWAKNRRDDIFVHAAGTEQE
jgi:peptidoglycan-associated lipoprotein